MSRATQILAELLGDPQSNDSGLSIPWCHVYVEMRAIEIVGYQAVGGRVVRANQAPGSWNYEYMTVRYPLAEENMTSDQHSYIHQAGGIVDIAYGCLPLFVVFLLISTVCQAVGFYKS